MQDKKILTKQYLRCVKDCFPFFGKQEKLYLSKLSVHVNEYLDFNSNATYNALISEFGSPTVIVSDYFSSLDEDYLFKKIKKKRHISYIVKLITILSILLYLWLAVLIYQDAQESKNAHIAYETITIEEIEE